MITWLKSLFTWKRCHVGQGGAWSYWENAVTGRRKICRESSGHVAPDMRWLQADGLSVPE